jgi:hypothetical protein
MVSQWTRASCEVVPSDLVYCNLPSTNEILKLPGFELDLPVCEAFLLGNTISLVTSESSNDQ